MKKIYYPLLALAFAAAGCTNGGDTQSAGIKMENMDQTAKPGTDFYKYACGGWQQLHPLTDEYSRFGSFDKLAEDNREQLRSLIEGIAATQHEKGSVEQKIGDLFNIAMDSARLNREGIEPIKADLAKIDGI